MWGRSLMSADQGWAHRLCITESLVPMPNSQVTNSGPSTSAGRNRSLFWMRVGVVRSLNLGRCKIFTWWVIETRSVVYKTGTLRRCKNEYGLKYKTKWNVWYRIHIFAVSFDERYSVLLSLYFLGSFCSSDVLELLRDLLSDLRF